MIEATLLKKAMVAGHGTSSILCTWVLKYPRFIHAELMTHRMFSRNAASSRAIPTLRLIRDVITEPAMPVFWGRNRKGMQAAEQHVGLARKLSIWLWLMARWPAVLLAWLLYHMKLHKQIVNRIIEPWSHITVIMTSGYAGLMNFFALRAHPDAQPEFQALAYLMLSIYSSAETEVLEPGEWYVPMWNASDEQSLVSGEWLKQVKDRGLKGSDAKLAYMIEVACGRIARVSYLTHDGRHAPAEDCKLHDRLAGANPMHASPFESVARAATPEEFGTLNGNLPPQWVQYRKTLPGESTTMITSLELRRKLRESSDWVTELLDNSSVRVNEGLQAVTHIIR